MLSTAAPSRLAPPLEDKELPRASLLLLSFSSPAETLAAPRHGRDIAERRRHITDDRSLPGTR